MPRPAENVIWQYWETHGEKPRFVDGLHRLAARNSGVRLIQVTPETLYDYLPDLEHDVLRIGDPAHKADMIRTRLVLRHGGMWLDSDAVVLGDLNWLFALLDDHAFVGFNDAGQLQAAAPWVRVNCFLSRPGGAVVREWVRRQRERLPRTAFGWNEIGAEMLNPICLDHQRDTLILPFERICPIPWDEVQAFTTLNDAMAERILRDCFIVMLSNRSLQTRNAALLRLTVDEMAAGDYLLARIMQKAAGFEP